MIFNFAALAFCCCMTIVTADVYVFTNSLFKTDGNIGNGRYLIGENSICSTNQYLNSSIPLVCNRTTTRAWLGCGPTEPPTWFSSSANTYLSDAGLYYPLIEGAYTWGNILNPSAISTMLFPGNMTYVWTGLLPASTSSQFCCNGFTSNIYSNGQITYRHSLQNQGVFAPNLGDLGGCANQFGLFCLCEGVAPPLITTASKSPSKNPTRIPSRNPTKLPSSSPSRNPTQPTRLPSSSPSKNPTRNPSKNPTSDADRIANTIGFWTAMIVVGYQLLK